MANDDTQDKILRARLAMEGEERANRRAQSEAEVAKMRQEAMLAMEGAERKAAREAKLKAEQDRVENEKRRLAEAENLKALEEKRQKDAEFKALVEQQKIEKAKEAQVEKIHQAEAKIADIKKTPEVSISSVRTLQSDLAHAVEKRQMSATSIAVQNQSQKQISFAQEEPRSNTKTILTILLIVVLIAAGGGVLWYAQVLQNDRPVTLENLNIPKLISIENTEVLNFTATTSANQIKSEIKNKLAGSNNTVNLYLTANLPDPENPERLQTTFLTPTNFNTLAELNIDGALLRALGNDFTIGTLAGNTKTPFIIFQVNAYDRALASMFNWESTLAGTVAEIWPESSPTIGTSTSRQIIDRNFKNKRVNNLDARVLYYNTQEPAVAYAFFNNKYIIIAADDRVIGDLVARLAP